MDASKRDLGVEPVLTAKQMVQPDVPHIGVMAYAAWHRHVEPSEEETEEIIPAPPLIISELPPEPATPEVVIEEEESEAEEEPPVEEVAVKEPEEEEPVAEEEEEAPAEVEEAEEEPAPPVTTQLTIPLDSPTPQPQPQPVAPTVRVRRAWLIHMQQTIAVLAGSTRIDHVTSSATSADERTIPLTVTRVAENLYYIHFLPTLKGLNILCTFCI